MTGWTALSAPRAASTKPLPAFVATPMREAKAAREAADYGLAYNDGAADAIIRDAEEVCRVVIVYLRGSTPGIAE